MFHKTNHVKIEQRMISNISTVHDRQAVSFPASLPIPSTNQATGTKKGNSMIYEDKVAITSLFILVILGIIVSLLW